MKITKKELKTMVNEAFYNDALDDKGKVPPKGSQLKDTDFAKMIHNVRTMKNILDQHGELKTAAKCIELINKLEERREQVIKREYSM